ncbi:MAG: FeoB-associated Cys-rich membrane protein [Clostridiales bacterium]|nr:FeoB-associated Cys-rich membrane protein [Clostridiales bacterium]
MNPIDIILIIVIVLILAGAVFLALRRKKTSSCCSGNCAECMKNKDAGDCRRSASAE